MSVSDIEGSSPKKTYDSLKIKTRHVNPLMPEYNMPGNRIMNEYGDVLQSATPV